MQDISAIFAKKTETMCCKNHSHCKTDGHNHGCHHHSHSHSDRSALSSYKDELLSAILLLSAFLLDRFGILGRLTTPEGKYWPEVAAYLIALLPVGIPVVKEMIESWCHGSIMNEFTLMVAAAAGAFFIGEYPEGVAVLLFYSFGEKLEDNASDNVRQRIRSLLGRLPDKAMVKRGDTLVATAPEELAPGTEIVVLPGERVPIDSLLSGTRDVDFDTSAITGESVPRTYHPGQEILSGMIPVDKRIEATTLRPFADSSMTRIMQMIENAQASKSPTEHLLRKITRWYTPAVFVLAMLVLLIPWMVSAIQGESFEWHNWLRRSLVFLVCSCPCALVVSIPLSYFASLGVASKNGLLFKGAKFVDALRGVDTVMFDKTGTLTTGEFHVSAVTTAPGIDADSVVGLAAALDSQSRHPLAKAITNEAVRRKLAPVEASGVTTIPHGITGTVDGASVIVGSPSLMASKGIAIQEFNSDASEICVARDGILQGVIFLLDTVKPEAAEAINMLHREGIRNIVILSGDNAASVSRVAKEIGADDFRASLMPAEKQQVVAEATAAGHNVAFVGDGINDAPAISAASVGVSMGKMGTDLAMESSDVVIAADNLLKLPEGVRLARKVRRVVTENVTLALGVKVLVMTLGACGIASLWAAVFADTGVTLCTVIWTLLRLKK